ncbi:hypothetical protein ACNFR7_15545 [Streptomyces sp. RM1]
MDSIGGLSIESVHAAEVYQILPASRFDYDWEFLANESGLLDVSDRAHDFLEADVAEEDLWDEWFKPYTDVEPRATTRGVLLLTVARPKPLPERASSLLDWAPAHEVSIPSGPPRSADRAGGTPVP